MSALLSRARLWAAAVATAALAAGVVLLMPPTLAQATTPPAATDAAATDAADAAAALPACPFWAAGITPPARSTTPWVAPLQTAPAVDFATRQVAPTLTGALVNGQVTLTVSPVPNAVAYRVWRDGVNLGYISYWGQTGPLTVTDTAPCQGAYYDVVAMYDTSNSDASLGQLSQPYWLGADGTVAPGAGDVPVGTQISMMVTSYDNTGSTASGYNAQLGMCATDPRVIPWGTYFSVPGYGTCYAADLGTWIQNDTVDVWLPDAQANNWGVQDRTVTVIANPYASGGGTGSSPSASASASAPASSSPSASASASAPGSGSASASPSASASASARPTSTASGSCAVAWNSSTSYSPGQIVSYQGTNYTATYYSTGAVPGAATSWAVWSSDGPCSS
ncbi:3D domain-containing protein [Actinospica robiniae]|uniref:3D domain-containing protein n=1 Tax=Actinospica robiniae TaxID=304901 RepID=UPI0004176388|nr:3D domain-containing protein [Actinospica robiniae]